MLMKRGRSSITETRTVMTSALLPGPMQQSKDHAVWSPSDTLPSNRSEETHPVTFRWGVNYNFTGNQWGISHTAFGL